MYFAKKSIRKKMDANVTQTINGGVGNDGAAADGIAYYHRLV